MMLLSESIGKFSGEFLVSEILFSCSPAPDESDSDMEFGGAYVGLYIGPFDADDFAKDAEEAFDIVLPQEDRDFVAKQAAAVAIEDNDGFVSVRWFTSLEKARAFYEDVKPALVEEE